MTLDGGRIAKISSVVGNQSKTGATTSKINMIGRPFELLSLSFVTIDLSPYLTAVEAQVFRMCYGRQIRSGMGTTTSS